MHGRLGELVLSYQPRPGIIPDAAGILPDPFASCLQNAMQFQRPRLVQQVLTDQLCPASEQSGHQPREAFSRRLLVSERRRLVARRRDDSRV